MLINFEERGPFAFVELNRPERRNALTVEMLGRLEEIFAGVGARADLRAVILSGAGRHFCAGSDIGELETLDATNARRRAELGQSVCDAVELCGLPVICAIEGTAAGGGCELALACHLRIASRDARLTLPELRLGLMPAYGGTQRLARAAGTTRALAAMLAGEGIGAEDAFRHGLVNRIVEPGLAREEAEALARLIAENSSPLAARACLEAVTRGARLPFEESLRLEAELFARLFSTSDAREGTRAFLEKRAPKFEGK